MWHAFHSLLYPVLVTAYCFPSDQKESWLSKKAAITLATPVILTGSLIFFTRSKERPPGQLSHFMLMLVLMGLLAWLATRFPALPRLIDERKFSFTRVCFGAANFVAFILIPVLMSRARMPLPIFFGYYASILCLIAFWFSRRPSLALTTCLLFAVGDEILSVGFATPGALHRAGILELFTDIGFLVIFILFLGRIRSQARVAGVPAD